MMLFAKDIVFPAGLRLCMFFLPQLLIFPDGPANTKVCYPYNNRACQRALPSWEMGVDAGSSGRSGFGSGERIFPGPNLRA